jgi:hypothetical protein
VSITVDKTATAQAVATSATATFATNPQAGDIVVVMLWFSSGNVTDPTVKDNGSTITTFTRDALKTDGAGQGAWIFSSRTGIFMPSSGAYKVTVTPSSTADLNVACVALLGAKAGAPLATNTGTATSTAVNSGAAGSGTGNYYAGVFTDGTGANPETITDNWTGSTRRLTQTNGSGQQAGAANDLLGSGSQTAAWTLGDSVSWFAALAVYAPGAVAGPYPARQARRVFAMGVRARASFVPSSAAAPVAPAIVPFPDRESMRLFMTGARARNGFVISTQAAPAAPAIVPFPARSSLRAATYAGGRRAKGLVMAPTSVPSASRQTARPIATPRRQRVTSGHLAASPPVIVPAPRRPRSVATGPRRAALRAPILSADWTPWPAEHRPAAGRVGRHLIVPVIPPQVFLGPPLVPFPSRQSLREWAAVARARTVLVVPAQVAVVPPVWVPAPSRMSRRPMLPAPRARTVLVVPAQVILPPPPWVPAAARQIRTSAIMLRRGFRMPSGPPGGSAPGPFFNHFFWVYMDGVVVVAPINNVGSIFADGTKQGGP